MKIALGTRGSKVAGKLEVDIMLFIIVAEHT